MDVTLIVRLAALLIIFGLMFYAVERLPLSRPAWLRGAIEALLAVIAALVLLSMFFGVGVQVSAQ